MKTVSMIELVEIAECLGNRVHELWMAKRRREKGWHAPGECKEVKERWCGVCRYAFGGEDGKDCGKGHNDIFGTPKSISGCDDFEWGGLRCQNCHPCMLPYSELPDSEKELDMQYPREFIKILHSMGYEITKRK